VLFPFASDAFKFGDMKAHQFSLAAQTLLNLIASRIEKLTLAKGNSTFVYHVDGLQKYFRKAGLHQSACQSHRVLDNLVNMSHPNATMRERGRKGNWETHRVFDGC
jgi:hypothetical protein